MVHPTDKETEMKEDIFLSISSFRGEYGFLSNFYSAPVKMYGIEYPTVEHAFVAAKTLDLKERAWVRNCKTPADAKRLGRKLTLRRDWNTFRLQAMYELVKRKFTDHEWLRKKLLATGNMEIREGNRWHDNFWGNCTCPRCCGDRGQNHLGRILMQVRRELRE
jgi:ribA/ribD-fused uncharacterized protein